MYVRFLNTFDLSRIPPLIFLVSVICSQKKTIGILARYSSLEGISQFPYLTLLHLFEPVILSHVDRLTSDPRVSNRQYQHCFFLE
ncbi:hypothetical protein HanPSC8_Chr01g0009741 [Helianthus annuus]|nr:hypothetical protein HanPSC8_Chr01g0009741 [Helianthus annuus]